MNNPIELLKESFSHSIKKPALIMGLIYFGLAIVITLGAIVVGALVFLVGAGILGVINNFYVTIISFILGALIGLLVLLFLQSGINILGFKGFSQVINDGNYNFDEIIDTIKRRIVPSIVAIIITSIIFLSVLAVLVITLFLLLQEIGLFIAIGLFLIFALIVGPLFLVVTPLVVLDNVGGFEAVVKSISMGIKNYLFNLGNIALILFLTFALVLVNFIPIIGFVASFYFTILYTIFIIKIYEENKARSNIRIGM